MILGLGVDMIEVRRIAVKIGKELGFRELVFSRNEIEYCEKKTHKFEHYAARFAAKEAFLKALGTGWSHGTHFNEIEVVHDDQGKPRIVLSGETGHSLEKIGPCKIWVSLSHLKEIASALVIIEQ